MARVRRVNIHQAGMRRLVSDPSTPTYRHMVRVGVAVWTTARGLAPRDKGQLAGSGRYEMRPRYPRLTTRIGFHARHAWWVHEGTGIYGPRRRMIRPVRAPFMVWRDPRTGRLIRAKKVRGMRPRPFLANAVRAVTGKSPRRTGGR